jgi:hypothetical protein
MRRRLSLIVTRVAALEGLLGSASNALDLEGLPLAASFFLLSLSQEWSE